MTNPSSWLARVAQIGICIATLGEPLSAQSGVASPQSIGRLLELAIDTLMPPDKLVSRVTVSRRRIHVDVERTIRAFGLSGAAVTPLSSLTRRTSIHAADRSVLADCDQKRMKPCQQLGWGIYVWLEPVESTSAGSRVRASFLWADRGPFPFEEGIPAKGVAVLVGFSIDISFTRAASGEFRLAKLGQALVW